MSPTQSLDHLILFVPADADKKLPQLPSFFEPNFSLTPGGFHADGATSNTLILLADGCYIELISFIDTAKVGTHWWGPDAEFVGWRDWCLTNSKSPKENYDSVKETHVEPNHGGRKRADGVDVKWAVTFPKGEKGGQDVRGRIPFFCHDTTPRNIRVPLSEESTAHTCGALGVRQFTIVLHDQELLNQTRHVYAAVLGDEGLARSDEASFNVGRVHDVEGLNSPARIVLRLPKNEKEIEATVKAGYCYGDVILGAKATPQKTVGTKERLDEGGTDVKGLWVEYV